MKDSLEGCGDLACASTAAMCVSGVMNMVFEIGFAIASIAALVATGGLAAPAAIAGRELMKKMGKQGAKNFAKQTAKAMIRSGLSNFQKAAMRQFKNFMVGFKEDVLKNKAKYIAEAARDGWSQNAVKNFCKEYQKATYKGLDGNKQSFDPTSLDPTGTAEAVIECKKGVGATCMGKITGVIGTFDPTGLMGVAAAFMHDSCAFPPAEDPKYNLYWAIYGSGSNSWWWR